MESKLVIGCGTGRCGTTTLATLLNAQPDSLVTHERFNHKFRWGKPSKWRSQMLQLAAMSAHQMVGDVALQWGCDLPMVLQHGARVVVLKREQEAFVESFMRKSGRRNNWQPKGQGGTPNTSPWFGCFPQFSGQASKRAALRAYWEFYYRELVAPAAEMWPDQLAIFYLDVFNSEAGQRRLLSWLGIPEAQQVIRVGIRKNKTRRKRR